MAEYINSELFISASSPAGTRMPAEWRSGDQSVEMTPCISPTDGSHMETVTVGMQYYSIIATE